MPKTGKSERRQRKKDKRRKGMQVGSRSVFTIREQIIKRGSRKEKSHAQEN